MKNINAWFYLPAILIAALIFTLSSFPQPEFIELNIQYKDKIFHFIAYFAFGSSLIMGFIRNQANWSKTRLIWAVLLIGAAYGASDELHQYFVPGRSCDFADWIADCLGISFSLLFRNIFDKLSFRIMTSLENIRFR